MEHSRTNQPLPHRFSPKYFQKDISIGNPVLTAEGRKAIEEEMVEAADEQLEAITPQVERPNPTESVQA